MFRALLNAPCRLWRADLLTAARPTWLDQLRLQIPCLVPWEKGGNWDCDSTLKFLSAWTFFVHISRSSHDVPLFSSSLVPILIRWQEKYPEFVHITKFAAKAKTCFGPLPLLRVTRLSDVSFFPCLHWRSNTVSYFSTQSEFSATFLCCHFVSSLVNQIYDIIVLKSNFCRATLFCQLSEEGDV